MDDKDTTPMTDVTLNSSKDCFRLTLHTQKAHDWVNSNLREYKMQGNTLLVSHKDAVGIVFVMSQQGLILE